MSENETNRRFRGLTEIRSGYVSFKALARNVFGISPHRLRNEYPFFDGEFYCTSGDLMPVIDVNDICEVYSGQNMVFLGEMTRSASYATPQAYVRALESVGSKWYIPSSGPDGTLCMEQSSYEAPNGPKYVREITEKSQARGYIYGMQITEVSSLTPVAVSSEKR